MNHRNLLSSSEDKAFVRVEPRIGERFQVRANALPDAKAWKQQKNNDAAYGCCVWNADQAEQSSDTSILEAIVPHDRKEAALTLFHFNSYKIDGILGLILQTKPKHGMDWSIETKQAFERSIIKSRKDFVYVSKVVRQSVGDCLNYYYACFKQMSEYGSLKKLLGEDLEKKRRLNVCAKCNKDGELVCCSICQSSYHSQCCTYLPTNSETSDWFCDDCDPQD